MKIYKLGLSVEGSHFEGILHTDVYHLCEVLEKLDEAGAVLDQLWLDQDYRGLQDED